MNETDKLDELDEYRKNEAWKRERFDRFTSDMTEDLRNALEAVVFSQVYLETVHIDGANAILKLEYNAGYERTLTLIDAFGIPQGEHHELDFKDFSLNLSTGLYQLAGETYNWDEDTSQPFVIRFKDAKVGISVYNAMYETYAGTPWHRLTSIAWTIMNKYSLSGDYLNTKEKELMPLVAELCMIPYWGQIPHEYETTTLPLLKGYAQEYNYKKIVTLIDRAEKEPDYSEKRYKLTEKLMDELNKLTYEPLWRELYNLIADSQADYPVKASTLCPSKLLAGTRSQIQQLMEGYGYTGTYPDFKKSGSIKGIHLAESYNLSYFVGLEKNVNYHIHCTEEYDNNHLTIEFLCGTELLKKNDTPGDIYSCSFNAKGRRYFQNVTYNAPIPDEETDDTTTDDATVGTLEDYVRIATKRAELKKLTKDERMLIFGFTGASLPLFLFVFVIMGGLFGLFMTLGLMAMAVVLAILFGQFQTIPSMFTDIPWWGCLAFCWISFGGIMGIITVLIKNK